MNNLIKVYMSGRNYKAEGYYDLLDGITIDEILNKNKNLEKFKTFLSTFVSDVNKYRRLLEKFIENILGQKKEELSEIINKMIQYPIILL